MNDQTGHRAPILLSRYAEALFWLGRYMERIENLARILDVTDTFVRHGVDQSGWRSVVQINADEERFTKLYGTANAENVAQFYLVDRENPTSVLSSLFAARENARTLRPLIPTEMWSQINIFYNRVRQLTEGDAAPSRVSGLCAYFKEQCQAHAGITDGTFYRDQSWAFYCIGKYIERGDQTSRLVDIKYHTLLPSVDDVGGALDISQWHALLRAASGYQAYRRVNPNFMTPASVAGFPADEPVLSAQRDGVRASGRDTSGPAQFDLRVARDVFRAGASGRIARGADGPDGRPDTGARPARVPRLGAAAVHRFAGQHGGRFLAQAGDGTEFGAGLTTWRCVQPVDLQSPTGGFGYATNCLTIA